MGAINDTIGQQMTKSKGLFKSRHFVPAGKWRRFGSVKKRELFYFWRADFWFNLSNFFLFVGGFGHSFLYFRRLRPHLLFSKGGYVAVGPCLAARLLKIPLILHDSDAVSGVAHVFFKNYAQLRLSGFKMQASKKDASSNIRHVGVPVNPAFAQELEDEKREVLFAKYNLPPNAKFILITGGGGGARNLNQGVLEVIDRLKMKSNTYFIIIAGHQNYEETLQKAEKIKAAQRVRIVKFVDNMPDLMRSCQGVVTRAGATILTEISLAQKAAIIVPNPLLPRAHQLHNARIFQRARAAWLVNDDGQNVNQRALRQAINELITDSSKRRQFENRVGQLALPDAALRVLTAVEEVIESLGNSSQDPTLVFKQRGRAALLASNQAKRQARRYRLIKRQFILSFKILILVVIVGAFLFKIFYVGSIQITLIEDSPLITQKQLTILETETQAFLEQRSFFERYFSLPVSELRQRLLDEGYIKEVVLERDLLRSQMLISIQPKYVLGNFEAPNARTIITTDGYAIQGYEHLLEKGRYALTIKSPQRLNKAQELVLSPLDISFLNQIKDYLAAQGYQLSEARISSQPREIVFKLKNYDYDIIALTTRDPIEQGIVLATTLEFFNRSQAPASGVEVIVPEATLGTPNEEIILPQEYIDIRLIDRVIYR